MDLKITSVFCDDIRQEVTGKVILVGVYQSDLVPGMVPSTFAMSLWVRVEGLAAGHHEFSFKITSPTGEVMVDDSNALHVPDDRKPIAMLFAGFPMTIKAAGEIKATFTFDKEEVDAGRLLVAIPSAIATPQI